MKIILFSINEGIIVDYSSVHTHTHTHTPCRCIYDKNISTCKKKNVICWLNIKYII